MGCATVDFGAIIYLETRLEGWELGNTVIDDCNARNSRVSHFGVLVSVGVNMAMANKSSVLSGDGCIEGVINEV